MNKRGFTLIELLAVLVALGIIFTISAPSMMNVFKQSKLKSEEIFVERLSQAIDSYVSLYKEEIKFKRIEGSFQKEEKKIENEEQTDNSYDVNVYKDDVDIKKIIETNILTNKDYINAGNKEITCSIDAIVEVYRDSDFVYCHKVKANILGCLSDTYKNKLANEQGTAEPYAIDTCVWKKK